MRSALVVILCGFGCSNAATSPADLGVGEDLLAEPDLQMAVSPTDHPPLVTVSTQGGPVIASPEIWTVVWQGDEALGAQVNAFHNWMLNSDYWTSSLSEYGVGVGVAKGVIVIPSTLPATVEETALGQPITQTISSHARNASSVFVFVVPAATQVTHGGVGECPNGPNYHTEAYDGTVYELVSQCSNGNPLIQALSHEAAEAATDPHSLTTPAWGAFDFLSTNEFEIADLCYGLTANYMPTTDAGAQNYVVTRLYSAKNAAAGMVDPCVPAPASLPYFNVAFDPLVVPVDSSAPVMVAMKAFAFGDVGAISWRIGASPGIQFTPSSGSLQAGEQAMIKVDVTNAGAGDHLIFVNTKTAGGTNVTTIDVSVD